ncbi:MAG: DivIVA domain-containing protein [candidate division Zixibacteria bacterium]|nr:DivIVA domain-containing protein [candidate division Zixibacteria bacterium]
MSLTANDIRSIEIRSQMRGYDKEEVDNLLEQVAVAIETTKQENVKLSMEIDSLRSEVASLKENEDVIKGAAIDARKNADATVKAAKKDAADIIKKAKEESKNIIAGNSKKVQEIEQHIQSLDQNRKTYLSKLRTLISSHLELAEREAVIDVREAMADAAENVSKGEAITVTNTEDVTTENREIIVDTADDEDDDRYEEDSEEEDSGPEKQAELREDDEPSAAELEEALKQYQDSEKGADGEPTQPPTASPPSLASPGQKWEETDALANEVPPGFIVKKNEPKTDAPTGSGAAPHPKANKTGKMDVNKEFNEIAAKLEDIVKPGKK